MKMLAMDKLVKEALIKKAASTICKRTSFNFYTS